MNLLSNLDRVLHLQRIYVVINLLLTFILIIFEAYLNDKLLYLPINRNIKKYLKVIIILYKNIRI